jgi:hypothetical protein
VLVLEISARRLHSKELDTAATFCSFGPALTSLMRLEYEDEDDDGDDSELRNLGLTRTVLCTVAIADNSTIR